MPRAYAFVDAEHVRLGLAEIGGDWSAVSLPELSEAMLAQIGAQWRGEPIRIDRTFVYGALPDGATAADNDVARWLAFNDRQPDTHLRLGTLVGTPPRQKGVDVRLAVEAQKAATKGIIEVAMLVAGDGDYAPLAAAIREDGVLVILCGFQSKLSDDLMRAADRVGYLPDELANWSWLLRRGANAGTEAGRRARRSSSYLCGHLS